MYSLSCALVHAARRLQLPESRVLREVQRAYPAITEDLVARASKGIELMLAGMKGKGSKKH